MRLTCTQTHSQLLADTIQQSNCGLPCWKHTLKSIPSFLSGEIADFLGRLKVPMRKNN